MSNCMWLKTIIAKDHYNGLTPKKLLTQYRVNQNVKERKYLTGDKIKTVMIHEFSNKKLAYIWVLFVFANFTSLSFVNIKKLTTDNIAEVNGEKWILPKRHKTKVNFQVKLLDIPLQIIKRYEKFQKNRIIFPNLNYWSICKPLKQMIREDYQEHIITLLPSWICNAGFKQGAPHQKCEPGSGTYEHNHYAKVL